MEIHGNEHDHTVSFRPVQRHGSSKRGLRTLPAPPLAHLCPQDVQNRPGWLVRPPGIPPRTPGNMTSAGLQLIYPECYSPNQIKPYCTLSLREQAEVITNYCLPTTTENLAIP